MRIIDHTPLSCSVGELVRELFAMLFCIFESGLEFFDECVNVIDTINQN
jgi:hypothetical protein